MTAREPPTTGAPAARVVLALHALPPVHGGRAARRREQSRVARSLAQAAAARLAGEPPAAIGVTGGGATRPQLLRAAGGPLGLELSLAHSGLWAGAAVGSGVQSLGLDLQQVAPRPVDRLVAYLGWSRLLAADGTTTADPDAFTQSWTLWEAAIKCDGASLLAATTPAFEQLQAGFQPGAEASWYASGYWACSRRLDAAHWLTVVARCGPATVPHLDLLPTGQPASAAQHA